MIFINISFDFLFDFLNISNETLHFPSQIFFLWIFSLGGWVDGGGGISAFLENYKFVPKPPRLPPYMKFGWKLKKLMQNSESQLLKAVRSVRPSNRGPCTLHIRSLTMLRYFKVRVLKWDKFDPTFWECHPTDGL